MNCEDEFLQRACYQCGCFGKISDFAGFSNGLVTHYYCANCFFSTTGAEWEALIEWCMNGESFESSLDGGIDNDNIPF